MTPILAIKAKGVPRRSEHACRRSKAGGWFRVTSQVPTDRQSARPNEVR